MSTYTKTYALPTVVTPTFTITSQFVLPIRKVCATDLLGDPCCGFNFNRCGTDIKYFQPVCIACPEPDPDCLPVNCAETDILNFQFSFPDNFNNWGVSAGSHSWEDGLIPVEDRADWLIAVSVIQVNDDCTIQEICDANLEDYGVAFYVGGFKNGKTIQGIQIDPSQIPCCKFYFKFELQFAIGDIRTYYTEPYEKANGCQNTVKLEGIYPKTGQASTDCDGKFYGEVPFYLGTLFFYENYIRIYGEFKQTKFIPDIVQTTGWNGANKSVVSSTNTSVYRLRSRKLPLYVIERLKTILGGKKQIIEEREFIFSGSVENKTPDMGTMWMIENEFNEISGCLNQFSDCAE